MPAHRSRALLLVALAVAIGTPGGCGASRAELSQAIQQVLSGPPLLQVKPEAWRDARAFYAQHPDAAWAQGARPSRRAGRALAVVRKAREHGLDPADYGDQDLKSRFDALQKGGGLTSKVDAAGLRQAADFDVRLTTALLALARDVGLGRTPPTDIDPQWKARRQAPDFAGSLARGVDGDLKAWLDSVRPAHPEYAALQKLLAAATDAPADDRYRQIAANLERWRWLPDDFGPRYLLVNIPSFHVLARENGQTVKDIRVIVGKPADRTPVFSATLTTVVFSPYWNIPDTIAQNETVPAVLKDRNYLEKNQIEILRRSKNGEVTVVAPGKVHWNDAAELKELAFRQQPGAKNALGHVSFLFPNPFAVYLHDTPADELFARPGRALSHGCIRVEEPLDLAKYVLRGDADWDEEQMVAAMNAGVEKHVKLKEQFPVHIVYFTAWPDDQGGLQVYPDIYGYDRLPQTSIARAAIK